MWPPLFHGFAGVAFATASVFRSNHDALALFEVYAHLVRVILLLHGKWDLFGFVCCYFEELVWSKIEQWPCLKEIDIF